MKTKIEMFLIPNHGGDTDNVKLALSVAATFAKDNKLSHVCLLIPKKQGADSTVIAEALGEATIKALLKSPMDINGIRISIESASGFSPSTQTDVVVALHVGKSGIDKATDSHHAKAIVYVPWHEDDGEEFRLTWHPKVVMPDGTVAVSKQGFELSSKLTDALTRLSKTINLSTGLLHTSDKKAAEELFKGLKKEGVPIDPRAVRAWAVTHNWRSDFADDLAKLAARYAK